MKRLIFTLLFISFIFSLPQKSSSLILGPGMIPIPDSFQKKNNKTITDTVKLKEEIINQILDKKYKKEFGWEIRIHDLTWGISSVSVYFKLNKTTKLKMFIYEFRFSSLNNNYAVLSSYELITQDEDNIVSAINKLSKIKPKKKK